MTTWTHPMGTVRGQIIATTKTRGAARKGHNLQPPRQATVFTIRLAGPHQLARKRYADGETLTVYSHHLKEEL